MRRPVDKKINKYSDQTDKDDTDDEKVSTFPVFDIFHGNSGSAAIDLTKTFAPDVFNHLLVELQWHKSKSKLSDGDERQK